MSNASKEIAVKNDVKKKRGFLGILMRIFLISVLVMAVITAGVYYKRKLLTEKFLEFYGNRLANVLTQPEYYQISNNEIPPDTTDAQYLQERRQQINETFIKLVATYKDCNNKPGWYDSLRELNTFLKEIFSDRKIYSSELDSFLTQVAAVTDKYRSDSPEQK